MREAAADEPALGGIFEPTDLSSGERRPLLIFLHGYGDTGKEAFEALALGDFGQRHRVFVLAPEGTPDSHGRQFWNSGSGCCDLERSGIDHAKRLGALIDRWRERTDVDPQRVYVVGHSNGGFMAHRLACRMGDRLAAVASTAGAGPPATQACPVRTPIGVLQVQGDRDRIVRPEGGHIFDDRAQPAYLSTAETIAAWSQRLGCLETETSQVTPPGLPPMRIERHAPCHLGDLELWTIPGAGHGITSPALVDRIWSFLELHVKPAP
jgi:polyhydroxybutyrate depolymerase